MHLLVYISTQDMKWQTCAPQWARKGLPFISIMNNSRQVTTPGWGNMIRTGFQETGTDSLKNPMELALEIPGPGSGE